MGRAKMATSLSCIAPRSARNSGFGAPSNAWVVSSPDHDDTGCGSPGHAQGSVSTSQSPLARSKSCDVYVGFSGQKPSLLRFVKWLHAELQLHGVSCLVSNRRCPDASAHGRAKTAMDAATVGVVLITEETFSSPYSMEEVGLFMDRKNLLPVFFELVQVDGLASNIVERPGGFLWKAYGGLEEEWKGVVDKLSHLDYRLETNAGNWRDCISEVVDFVGMRLGRRSTVERVRKWKQWSEKEEFPFPRNDFFVGRSKELDELELRLFGYIEKGNVAEDFDHETFNRPRGDSSVTSSSSGQSVRRRCNGTEGKGKEPLLPKRSEDEEEIHDVFERTHHVPRSEKLRKKGSTNEQHGKGLAVVCGDSGIGKTELLLEFSYRLSQRYKMVLWIGGKARYIWQGYMNILPSLEVDMGLGDEVWQDKNHRKNFEELENQAISRARKELTRGIPYLIVIDNLETENDWWNGWHIKQLLPQVGGDTHILISTRLLRVMDVEPLRLPHFSHSEAQSIMRGETLRDLPPDEVNALGVIGERLGRLTLGLSVVQAILNELQMSPQKLLRAIDKIPNRDLKQGGDEEDVVLRYNPFLVRLLDFCLLVFDLADKSTNLSSRMIETSGWFAPSPVPVSLLAQAANEIPRQHGCHKSWRWMHRIACFCTKAHARKSVSKAVSVLFRFHIARRCIKEGFVYFHDIIRLYARERGDGSDAHAVVHAVNAKGCIPHHSNHIWEACFLLFRFGPEPAIVDLKAFELISFVKRLVLPLASKTFTDFCHCTAAIELLRQTSEKLELFDDFYISRAQRELGTTPCWGFLCNKSSALFDPYIYREFALVRATLLEMRAKLMHKGGFHDLEEQLYRSAVSIKEVVFGSKHCEAAFAQEAMEKLFSPKQSLAYSSSLHHPTAKEFDNWEKEARRKASSFKVKKADKKLNPQYEEFVHGFPIQSPRNTSCL